MRSKARIFIFPVTLIAFTAVLIYLRMLFATRFDLEIVNMANACRAKQAWSQKVTREYGPKIVACGGSSCAHSIRGMVLLERYGLPTVNMGLHAGFGATMLVKCALDEVRPGDTLLVAVEPALLAKPYEPSSFACKLACAMKRPEWALRVGEKPQAAWVQAALHCNIGWKWLLVFPNIRHKALIDNNDNLTRRDGSGWQTTSARPQVYYPQASHDGHLSKDGKQLLQWLKEWGDKNGVRVVYTLPWEFKDGSEALAARQKNGTLLHEISAILPALKDLRLGVCTDIGLFSDTLYHLTSDASMTRTEELARQIQEWEVWKPGELDAWEQQHLK